VGAVKFNYGLDDYVGSARKDDRYSVAGTLTYKLNRRAQDKAEVSLTRTRCVRNRCRATVQRDRVLSMSDT